MKVMVLGTGLQGRAVVHDLEQQDGIGEIIAVDRDISAADRYFGRMGYDRTRPVQLDVTRQLQLAAFLADTAPAVIICMLPIELAHGVAAAAVETGISFVSSNYTGRLQELDSAARARGVAILPEMGLDPGIDLVLGRLAVDRLDQVHGFYSYGGGVPAPECAAESPIKYKISWTFDRVLGVYTREARLIRNGKLQVVPGKALFEPEHIHEITFEDLGSLEAYPNGDAVRYVDLFGLGPELAEMGRFALRWPGHSRFWRKMVALGFLDDTPVEVNGVRISPRTFLTRCLPPRLQYQENERDLALLRVTAWGLKQEKKQRLTFDLVDYRDPESGLFAMNRTVGFSSSIAAQMILDGRITSTGVLSPVRHVPPQAFISEIEKRGIHIHCSIEELTDEEQR
jgi:saccharopine dehydrogenase-like NADP-dependent oxidoreductase